MFMIDDVPDATQEAAEKLRQSAEFSYNVARSNGDLTPQAKQGAMARTCADLQAKMQALQEATNGQATARREANLRTAFGSPSSDPSAAISARDAADRAGQLDAEDDRQALDLLGRADLNGDQVLASALAYRAYEMTGGAGTDGWSEVLSDYLASRPKAAAAVASLMASSGKPSIAVMSCFWVPIPPELASLSPWQITALAAS